MRKTITISIAILLVWTTLDSLNLTNALVSFFLVGALPGTTASLSPTMMLAIMTAVTGIIVFELLARRFGGVRKIRYHFINTVKKQDRLPKRRFGRA